MPYYFKSSFIHQNLSPKEDVTSYKILTRQRTRNFEGLLGMIWVPNTCIAHDG